MKDRINMPWCILFTAVANVFAIYVVTHNPHICIVCLFIAWYISAGIVIFGASFAYWQRGWPRLAKGDYYADINTSFIAALFPTITIFVLWVMRMDIHGLKFK